MIIIQKHNDFIVTNNHKLEFVCRYILMYYKICARFTARWQNIINSLKYYFPNNPAIFRPIFILIYGG